MGGALGDEGDEFQAMFEDANLAQKQSPPPPRDHYEETDYSSEDSNEIAFASDGTYNASFFDQREQSQDKAQANVDEREKSQDQAQANMDEREKSQDKAQANVDDKEQPILTQRKVMDLLMHHQALPNNTSEGLAASIWATKKQGFKDMLSGFQSPTGTTYRVALDLASVLFVSVAAADANRRSLMA
jgi:phage-related protein